MYIRFFNTWKILLFLYIFAANFGLLWIGFIIYQAKAENTNRWLNTYTKLLTILSINENNFWLADQTFCMIYILLSWFIVDCKKRIINSTTGCAIFVPLKISEAIRQFPGREQTFGLPGHSVSCQGS